VTLAIPELLASIDAPPPRKASRWTALSVPLSVCTGLLRAVDWLPNRSYD
jgi:hypothetical protein